MSFVNEIEDTDLLQNTDFSRALGTMDSELVEMIHDSVETSKVTF